MKRMNATQRINAKKAAAPKKKGKSTHQKINEHNADIKAMVNEMKKRK